MPPDAAIHQDLHCLPKYAFKSHYCPASSAKTRSDRDKLFHFWSKIKSQESQNKLFSFHCFISCAFNSRSSFIKKLQYLNQS